MLPQKALAGWKMISLGSGRCHERGAWGFIPSGGTMGKSSHGKQKKHVLLKMWSWKSRIIRLFGGKVELQTKGCERST